MTKQEKQRVARTNECNETIYDMRYGLNSNKTNKYNFYIYCEQTIHTQHSNIQHAYQKIKKKKHETED